MRPEAVVRRSFRCVTILAVLATALAMSARADNWPAWRRDGSGVALEKARLPAVWSDAENLRWRTVLPGEGNSSPIVWDKRVFLTASLDKGAKRLVLCLDADSGKLLWQTTVLPEAPSTFYQKTGFAAPTPVTDGQRVYAAFDTPGLCALDFQGKLLWKHGFGPIKSPYNMGSSPVLYKDLVLHCCDHNGQAALLAIDRTTGQERWRAPRKASPFGHYGTPLLIPVDGQTQVVVNGEPVIAYDPQSGAELWRCRGMKECVGPSAVFGQGLLYASSGRTGPVMAIDPRGRGDITETHVRLHLTSGGPYVPTPLVFPWLMIPGDNGRMLFYDAACKLVAEDRVRDHFTASPVAGDGKIYWCSERGKTYVFDAASLSAAKPTVKVLSINQLGGAFLASPAIADGRLYLRSNEALYCVAETGQARVAHTGRTLSGDFAQLKARYEEHRAEWTNEPLAQIRLETLEAIARLDDPQVIPFLLYAVQKEPHWDICEEAVKSLGRKGLPAAEALLSLLPDSRPFIRTVAISDLGRLRIERAVPALLGVARRDKQPLVRCASLDALAQIAQQHTACVAQVAPVVLGVLADPAEEAVVKQAALDGLALLPRVTQDERPEILRALVRVEQGANPRLAEKSRDILRKHYQATAAELKQARNQ